LYLKLILCNQSQMILLLACLPHASVPGRYDLRMPQKALASNDRDVVTTHQHTPLEACDRASITSSIGTIISALPSRFPSFTSIILLGETTTLSSTPSRTRLVIGDDGDTKCKTLKPRASALGRGRLHFCPCCGPAVISLAGLMINKMKLRLSRPRDFIVARLHVGYFFR
jgi:hypothetical protein